MYWLFIDFGKDFDIFFDVFVDNFSLRARNLLNLQKHLFLQWISVVVPFRETWFLMIFMIFYVTSFSIDCCWVLASILAPFWDPFGIKFNFGGWSFLFMIFWMTFLIKNDSQKYPPRATLFVTCSRTVSAHLYLLRW